MNLPPEMLAKWLPCWIEFADAAMAAGLEPKAEPVALSALADRAADWPSPFGQKRDQYVGAVLIWSAKAFCKQDSGVMRQTLEGLLKEAVLAFKARLARAVEERPALTPPAPVLRFRPRRDIDDVDDEG